MFHGLKRDASKVTPSLKKQGDAVYATGPCRIYIPKRFETAAMAEIGESITFVGIYAIAVGDYYAVDIIPALITTAPININVVKVDEVEYYEFEYDKGSEVISNTKLVQNKLLMYSIDSEIYAKGRVPGYLGYEDMAKLFDRSGEFGGMRLGANKAVMAMIAMTVARSAKDGVTFYRHVVKDKADLVTNPPTYVALRNIGITASNTTAKLLGSYFDKGLTSALINPSDRNEGIEDLLRQ